MKGIICCRECKSRHFKCHSSCESYLVEKKLLDDQNKKIRKMKSDESYYINTRINFKNKKK